MLEHGVSVWKRGSDRADGVLNIRHMQLADRGTATTSNLRPTDDTAPLSMAGEWSRGEELTSPVPVGCGPGACVVGGDSVAKPETLCATYSLEATNGHASEE